MGFCSSDKLLLKIFFIFFGFSRWRRFRLCSIPAQKLPLHPLRGHPHQRLADQRVVLLSQHPDGGLGSRAGTGVHLGPVLLLSMEAVRAPRLRDSRYRARRISDGARRLSADRLQRHRVLLVGDRTLPLRQRRQVQGQVPIPVATTDNNLRTETVWLGSLARQAEVVIGPGDGPVPAAAAVDGRVGREGAVVIRNDQLFLRRRVRTLPREVPEAVIVRVLAILLLLFRSLFAAAELLRLMVVERIFRRRLPEVVRDGVHLEGCRLFVKGVGELFARPGKEMRVI